MVLYDSKEIQPLQGLFIYFIYCLLNYADSKQNVKLVLYWTN
jgi:hypothetical protein